ncbi:FAD-binding oxidoreductase [Pseudonocardia endophytica]|uniref:FAD/FMN-containing dehydrogenase n=1 Tax=Pseudonocardia endophytica TaxID=401976 RepID=A0A4R1HQ81_PSEEN|nr:FAD-binding oxidoreductase [Pseudonocardia endophytica]TCK21919.1 FAD/FMN-containing dehydrogenase [Pseudonocardia endophytica]
MTPPFFRGEWLVPGVPGYDEARQVFNRRVDARPEVVASCAGVADVVAALRYAAERGMPADVRCTGVTFGGLTAGRGVVVDLSLMRGVEILPEQRIARVQGGVRGGDLQIEASVHGLAGVTGIVSTTGVGAWLAGGIGHLARRVGYACDNILAVELVTAAGEVVRASPEENPDLFWGVRGSTGNFGVVTALEVRLHEVPPVVHGGTMSWSLDRLDGPVRALREQDWTSDGMLVIGLLGSASLGGRGGLDLVVSHSGPSEAARADLERLRSFGAPDEENMGTRTFRELSVLFDEGYPPTRCAMDEQSVVAFDDELVTALVDKIREPVGGGTRSVELVPRTGAMRGAPRHASALRESAQAPTWGIGPTCFWDDPSEDAVHDRWVAEAVDTVRRVATVGGYEHPGSVGAARDVDGLRGLYGNRLERLRRLKSTWDPDNVFAGGQNIPPVDR